MRLQRVHTAKRRRTSLILLVATGILALGLFAGGCGGDDEEDETTAQPSAETVDVTAADYSFDLSATPTAETKEITLENVGEEQHQLIFARINEGSTLQEAIEAEGQKGTAEELGIIVAPPGGAAKQPIEIKKPLEPGNYAMVCTFRTKDGEPHYSLGQQEEFEIAE
jgi:hypothetical protein